MSIKHTLLLLPLVFLFACSGDNPVESSRRTAALQAY